jgi:NADH dehydrogenase
MCEMALLGSVWEDTTVTANPTRADPTGAVPTRILIIGGGYVGLYTALGLQRRLAHDDADVTLVSPESFMLYQPFLPEAASGSIEPRHVVVPLRPVLKRTRLITGRVTDLDHSSRTARVEPTAGEPFDLSYDIVVVAVGSVSRVLPVPGLVEYGIGFKTVAEAIGLRNRVLAAMDAAESSDDAAIRRRLLTFVVVGGGYAGIEAMAELEDMARYASRYYRRVTPQDLRWVLVEVAGQILPELSEDLGVYTLDQLRGRGFRVHLGTRLESVSDGLVTLSDGTEYESDTVVWTAGVRPNPILGRYGLPLDDRGRLVADEYLRVRDVPGAWTAGDAAAVPDLVAGGFTPPTAQHALRQARRLAENVAAAVRGEPPAPFRYRNLGALASLGLYNGVARVMGFKLRGFPAWFLHRTYHVSRVPTLGRKARVIADWTVALVFRRDVVQLGSLQYPREQFLEAGGAIPPARATTRSIGASEVAGDEDPGAVEQDQHGARDPSRATSGEQHGRQDRVEHGPGDVGDGDG